MAGSEHGSAKTVAELEAIAAAAGRPARQRTTTYGEVSRSASGPAGRPAGCRSRSGPAGCWPPPDQRGLSSGQVTQRRTARPLLLDNLPLVTGFDRARGAAWPCRPPGS